MYTVVVEAVFSAVHRVRLSDGTLEPRHGHDWVVRAHFARAELDEAGTVIDFGQARSSLQAVVAQLDDKDLNVHDGLAGLNPTAEILARYIFERLAERGLSMIRRVEVTEAPGRVAVFEPDGPVANTE